MAQQKNNCSDILSDRCICAKCYHQQFHLPVLRAVCILKVFKHCEEKPN